MKYISIFSGIEAASVAWHDLGWEPLALSETDLFASTVLERRFPQVPNLGDMTGVGWYAYRGKCELVVGGPPCQAFSIAGFRKSLDDDRGNLSLQFVRAIHAIQPLWFVIENVPGWFEAADNAFGCALGGLTGAPEAFTSNLKGRWPSSGVASGPVYGLAWRVFNSQFFGVPQHRPRVYIVGHLGGWEEAAKVLFEPNGLSWDREKIEGVEEDNACRHGSAAEKYSKKEPPLIYDWYNVVLRKMCTALGSNCGRSTGRSLVYESNGKNSRMRRLTPVECERLQGFPDNWTNVPWRNKATCPDGLRYVAVGNSMSVPVMRWIGRRIHAETDLPPQGGKTTSKEKST